MNILITGAAGNIGSALANSFTEDGLNIIAVDNLLTGNINKLNKSKNLKFYNIDVNDESLVDQVFRENVIEYVFHFAAVVGVERTTKNPLMVLNDINGFKNIFTNSIKNGVKHVYFSSSSEIYGEPIYLPLNEDNSPFNCKLPYAVVKNVGEKFAEAYFQEYGLNYTNFRFFNTYGPNQSEDFVIPKFINQAMKNEPITIFGDGSQTRTFLYVLDNVYAIKKCFYEKLYVCDTLNIGSSEQHKIIDLAYMVKELLSSRSDIIYLAPLKHGDMSRRQPDNKKMLNIFDKKFIELDEGILKTFKFKLNNREIL